MEKNIIILMLDTARAADVYSNPSLPTLNYLARNGTAYVNTVAPGTWTAPTHASLFMNSKVSSIDGVSQDFFRNGTNKIDPWMVKTKFLSSDSRTIASKVSGHGYYSVLFSNNPFLTSYTNLAAGFDKVYDVWLHSNVKYNEKLAERLSFIINGGAKARRRLYNMSYAVSRVLPRRSLDRLYLSLRLRLDRSVAKADGTYRLDRGAADTNRALERYLKYNYNYAPQFIFVNYIEAHENYPLSKKEVVQDKWLYLSGVEELTDDTASALHRAYRRRISYLDGRVRQAVSVLKRNGMLDNATIIITSDHGQAFGERGMLYHAMPPYEPVAKVPLISVNYENGKVLKVRDRVESPVSLVSLHDAILNLASGKERYLNGNLRNDRHIRCEHTGISEGWDEQLLMMLKDRSASANRIYKAKMRYNKKATALYRGNMKLIHFFGAKKDELYDLSKDPNEEDNMINKNRGLAKTLLSRTGYASG